MWVNIRSDDEAAAIVRALSGSADPILVGLAERIQQAAEASASPEARVRVSSPSTGTENAGILAGNPANATSTRQLEKGRGRAKPR